MHNNDAFTLITLTYKFIKLITYKLAFPKGRGCQGSFSITCTKTLGPEKDLLWPSQNSGIYTVEFKYLH